MRTYVFGTHEGEFPTHLVAGDETSKVWAAAPLEGPEHNAFFAIEGPTQQVLDERKSAIAAAGVKNLDSLPLCMDPLNCLPLIGGGGISPCDLLEHFLEIIFCILEGHEPITQLLSDLQGAVGANGVAAAYNGDGRFVVEVGVNNAEESAAARDLINHNTQARVATLHIARTVHRLG